VALDEACGARLNSRDVFPRLTNTIPESQRETWLRLTSAMTAQSHAVGPFPMLTFEDRIRKERLEELLRRRVPPTALAASEDDERLHANPPVEGAPPPPAPRAADLTGGQGQRRLHEPPSAPAPAPVVVRESQKVVFTLTAPEHVTVKVAFELFVWAHVPEERAKVLARAREELGRDILERAKGPVRIASGTTLSVRLTIPGAEIAEPEDTMVWEGESTCASFVVTLPELGEGGKSPGVAHIYANGVQVAKISFVLSAAGVVESAGVRYKKAFASYASDDRDAVLGRIQGIHKVVPEMEIFLDVVSLRSGKNWEQELWRVIPESDIFYLFWSHHARESEWVEKEWRCALKERGIEFIDPVPLESPRESPPPPELSSLHFNDWELAFRRR